MQFHRVSVHALPAPQRRALPSRPWQRRAVVLAGILMLLPLPGAWAATATATATATDAPSVGVVASTPDQDNSAQLKALERAGDAVVKVRVTATEGAGSAESIGQERSGSGVVIGPDGLILTIGYLLLEAETIEIVTQDDRTLPARQVGYDLATGFALLRPLVPMRSIEPVPLGDVAALKPGEPLLVAMGSRNGTEVGFTQLVATRPFSGYWEYHIDEAVFTSPPVANHTGAGLFNRNGELLGIGSLFVLESAGAGRALPGNMFVPVDLLRPVLAEMEATGKTRASTRPWLGLSSSERDGHVQVVRVDRRGPALGAGLQPGDVVLEIDGVKVNTLDAFYRQLWKRPVADADVELTVQQGDEVHKIRIRAVDRMQTLRKPAGV